jgi:hypothetical protein
MLIVALVNWKDKDNLYPPMFLHQNIYQPTIVEFFY